jgi:multicomponent Na+:H+ antiporter subunit B
MNSLILSAATRFLAPLMLAYSLFILLRGHNEPGGGFIGGLIAAVAFALYAKAEGTEAARRALRADPSMLSLCGLFLAVCAGVWGWLGKGAFLASVWPFLHKDAEGHESGLPIGSALAFDVGVYLVVVGAVIGLFLALEEDAARGADPDDTGPAYRGAAADDPRTLDVRAFEPPASDPPASDPDGRD